MASGRMHAKATIFLSAPAALIGLGVGGEWRYAVACSLGVLSGILLSPDLDIQDRTHTEYIMYQYLGWIGGAVWFAFWWPYAWLIPHRSPFSHWPVLGTLIRLVYIMLLGSVLWYGVSWLVTGAGTFLPSPSANLIPWMGWTFLGLALSDTLHYFMDALPFFRVRSRHKGTWWRRLL